MTVTFDRRILFTAPRCATLLLANLLLPLTASPVDSADRLVELLGPHERDMRKLGFMVKANPFATVSEDQPECDMNQVIPALRAAYVQQYRQQLSAQERGAAIAFFGSPQGQEIVKRQHVREATVLQAAANKEVVSEAALENPPALKAALAAFHATPAGRRFVDDAIDKQGLGGEALEAIRNGALMRCLKAADAAAKTKPAGDERPGTPVASAKRASVLDDVRFVLENQGAEEQTGFSVDLYPGTPTCDGPPVTVMRSSSPLSAQEKVQSVNVTPNKVLSFVMRATYPGKSGGEASCSPGALTFVATSGSEYRAVFRERDTNCWVELWEFDLENNRAATRVPVTTKRLKVDTDGRHSCDWGG